MYDDIWIIFICAGIAGLTVLGEQWEKRPPRKPKPQPKKKVEDNPPPPPPKKEAPLPPVEKKPVVKDELTLPLTDEPDQGEERAAYYRQKNESQKVEDDKREIENKEKRLTLREEEMKVTGMQKSLDRNKRTLEDRLKLYRERDSLNK